MRVYWWIAIVAVAIGMLSAAPAQGGDPLDEIDGTEEWDQVVHPPREDARDLQAEREAFRQEVADWEKIRQLWQERREDYVMEKATQQRHQESMKSARARPPKANIAEETLAAPRGGQDDWGDEHGQTWFEDSLSDVDRAIDAELGETGAVPALPSGVRGTRPQPVKIPPPGTEEEVGLPDAFRQSVSSSPDPREEDGDREAERLLRDEEERRLREAERRKRQEEAERRRREEEASAGAAAAADLLRRQEEEMRREQEALRARARLQMDNEGQVVDPELRSEMEAEEEED